MCYQEPVEILEKMLEVTPLTPNSRGYTPLDDFEHFCAYSGCSEELLGAKNFAWVKLAFITAKQECNVHRPDD
ncbi:hypothetical protein AB6809_29475 [Paraburkholderia sp. RCC_158]|uniref:hypothetical protein n=1 Tax=Paraburkholderia sp. RCC_158 TaxID=3239220 RepID=UPI003524B517